MDKVIVYFIDGNSFETECDTYEVDGQYVILYDEDGETIEIVQAKRIAFKRDNSVNIEDI